MTNETRLLSEKPMREDNAMDVECFYVDDMELLFRGMTARMRCYECVDAVGWMG